MRATVVPIGVPHGALQAIQLLVYEYDALGVEVRFLGAGATFQPWAQRCPERVPVTLGEGAACFEWSAAAPTGYFLWSDDFFERCAPLVAQQPRAASRTAESPIASPFAELGAIAERLRSAATNAADRAMVEEALAKLAASQVAHTREAEMQRGAEGFDNTESARRHADAQAQLLAEARRTLDAARTRLRSTQH